MSEPFKLEPISTGFNVRGTLNEQVSLDEVAAVIASKSDLKVIEFDFSHSKMLTSVGVMTWLKLLEKVSAPYYYSSAPIWLVSLFNSIPGFFKENQSYIKSMEVPFFCSSENQDRPVLLRISSDIPLLNNYKNFELPDITDNGQVYTLDLIPERYFAFLSQRHQEFLNFQTKFQINPGDQK